MRIWQRPKNKKKNKSGEMRPVGGRVLPDSCVFLTKTYDWFMINYTTTRGMWFIIRNMAEL